MQRSGGGGKGGESERVGVGGGMKCNGDEVL